VGISAVAGCLLATPVALIAQWALFPIVAWDFAALIYMVWVWATSWHRDAEETASVAVPQDPTRRLTEFLTVGAAVASLVAVGFVLGRASSTTGPAQGWLAALGVLSVVVSWTVVQTVFTLTYARFYYTGTDGGIDFHDDSPPAYSDFAYVSFTIGMTAQVSDTDLLGREIRKVALYHSLLSFLFITGIVATTINLVANL
jgi:uncharacterized membrane protein